MALTREQLGFVLSTLPERARKAYAQGKITDADLEEYGFSLGLKPDFSNVQSGSAQSEQEGPGILDILGDLGSDVIGTQTAIQDAALAGGKRTVGAAGFLSADESLPGPTGQIQSAMDSLADLVGLGDLVDDTKQRGREFYGGLFEEGTKETQDVNKGLDDLNFGKSIAEPLTDVAGSPSSLASIFGGPLAAVPAADVYAQEYTQARLAGLDKDQAKARAGLHAGVEGLVEAIPAGKVLDSVPGLEKLLGREAAEKLLGDVAKTAIRTGKTAAGEGLEEGVTTLAQLGIDATIARTSDDPELRDFANSNLPEDIVGVWDATWRSVKAGAAGGAGLGGPVEVIRTTHERAKLASEMLAANASTRDQLREQRLQTPDAIHNGIEGIAPRTEDMFGTPEGLPSQEDFEATRQKELEQDAGFSLMRKQRAVDAARQRKINGVKAQLDNAAKTVEKIQDAISDGRVSGAQANTLVAGIKRVNELQQELDQLENQATIAQPKEALPEAKEQLSLNLKVPPDPRREAAKAEAQSLIQQDKATQEKSRVEAYNKLRTKVRSDLIKDSRELPDDKRTEYVADQLAAWDEQNPLDKFVVPTKTTSKPAAKKPLTVKPREEDVKVEEVEETTEGLKGVEELKAALGKPMAQETTEPKTDTKSADLLNTLAGKMSRGDVKKIGKMIADKNMVIVDDVSEVPGNATERGAGFFDGNRTYIVANRINKKHAIGEMLSIAAHEVKHQADLAGTPQLKASLGGFIGKPANTALNKKIEALAKGDKQVAKVVEAARKGSQNDEQYALELPAYFINYARSKRDQKGPIARLAGNVVSAVRTKFGSDVNLDDVAYMSDKLLKEVAVQGDRLTTTVDEPLPMFVSKGRGKMEASLGGRTYESVDGNIKYEISDDNSSITRPMGGGDITQAMFRAPEILRHDKLYEELPELREVRIRFINEPQRAFRGEYIPAQRMVTLNLAHLKDRNGFTYAGDTHRTLLHEMQHAAQHRSGTTGGSNPERHETGATKQYEAAIRSLERMIADAEQRGDPTAELNNMLVRMNKSLDQEYEKAFNDYRSVLGEHEARATADRIPLTQRQRDKQVGDLETIYALDTGKILDENGVPFVTKEQIQGMPDYVLAFNPDFLYGVQDYTESRGSKLLTILKTQFQNFGGLDRKLGVAKEDADGFAARAAHRAMNFYARINEGISVLARKGVKEGTYKTVDEGRDAIKDMIEGRLASISKIEDQNRREAALAGLVREHPELRSLAEALSEVNNLSRTILLQMIEDNPNPTPKELKQMNTIYNNMFRYSTRLYAAFQGEPGRERSRRLVNEYKHGKDTLAKRGEVPPRFRESFETYTKALKYIIDHDITIPEDEVLQTYKQDRIDQLFDTWVQDGAARTKQLAFAAAKAQGMSDAKARGYVRDYMLEQLSKRREEITDTQYEATAHDIIRGMLELEESASPFANYYRGFKQDRGILMEREHVDPTIRELLGEITDPATRLAVTISKQGELVARTRLLLDMKEKGNGKWVMPAVDARLPGNEKFSVELGGENWGPLKGWRATPEVARSIGDTVEMIQTLTDALAKSYQNTSGALQKGAIVGTKGVIRLAGAAKMLGVVFEPFGMFMNFLGSFAVPIANGVVNPKYYASGMAGGAQVIMDTMFDGKGKLTPQFEDAVRWGILDSARVQEIRRTPQEFVRKLISNKPKTLNALFKVANRTKDTTVEMFAMADAWAKITAFHQRVDVLKDFYKAERIEKTDDEIKSEAADQIKDTNITYARTIAAVRNLESVGLTTYLPYFYSVPRALTYGYIQAGKDLTRGYHAKTAKGKQVMIQQGLQRLVGNSVATMGVVALLKSIAAAINDDDDKLDEMKKLMTEDARFADSIYLGKDDSGSPLFARLSRVDAYGPVTDALRVVMDDNLSPEDKTKYTARMISDLIFTNRFTKSAIQATYDYLPGTDIRDKKVRIERVFPKATENIKDWIIGVPTLDKGDAESAMAVLDSFSPGWLDTFDPTNKVVKEPKSRDAEILGEMITMMGGRLDRADPGLASSVAGAKVRDARDAGRARLADGLAAGRSEEKLTSLFLEYANKEYDAIREVSDIYSGMVNGLDMSPAQAGKVLKEDGKLTNTDVAAIRQGRIIGEADEWVNQGTRMLSKKSMTQRFERLTPDEQEQAEERAKALREKMKALGYKVRE